MGIKEEVLCLNLGHQEVESSWDDALCISGTIPCICYHWTLRCSWQLGLCGQMPYWQGSSSQRQCVDRIEVEDAYPLHLTRALGTCKEHVLYSYWCIVHESTNLSYINFIVIIVESMKLLCLATNICCLMR